MNIQYNQILISMQLMASDRKWRHNDVTNEYDNLKPNSIIKMTSSFGGGDDNDNLMK